MGGQRSFETFLREKRARMGEGLQAPLAKSPLGATADKDRNMDFLAVKKSLFIRKESVGSRANSLVNVLRKQDYVTRN
jgi:hypothetical protein